MMPQDELEQMKQVEMMKETVLRKILTKDAKERLSRIKLTKSEFASQLELYLLQLYQNGQIQEMITDEKLKEILNAVASKPKFNIRR